jgi:single-strand DNA-binding protein
LTGKVTRVGVLKYTPSGVPVADFTLAVSQRQFDRDSIGYFDALLFGDLAEGAHSSLRIGKVLSLTGSLWSRAYRDRKGIKVSETKIIVQSIGGTDEKE